MGVAGAYQRQAEPENLARYCAPALAKGCGNIGVAFARLSHGAKRGEFVV
jgi:hypothetical protein